MSNELEGRVARLERALTIGHNMNLAEHDDADQAKARAKQAEIDKKAGDKANAAAAAELEPAAEPAEDVEATDAAAALAESEGVDINDVVATGASGQVTVDDVRAYVAEAEEVA